MYDYYRELNVDYDANLEEIKAAYRDLARHWHPDVNSSPEATDTFIRITEAYEILRDQQTRREYDEYRANRQREWERNQRADTARNTANIYAKMPFPDFMEEVLRHLENAAFYGRHYAVISFVVYVFFIGGGLALFGGLGFLFRGAKSLIFGLILLGFGAYCIYEGYRRLSQERASFQDEKRFRNHGD